MPQGQALDLLDLRPADGAQPPTRHAGQGPDLGLEVLGQVEQVHVPLHAGLVDEVHGPQLEAAQGHVRAFRGQRREQEYGDGGLLHDLLEGLEAAQARHLDVEGHHVGLELLDLVVAVLAVDGHSHHLDVGRGVEHARERAAHEGGVVHHQHADHAGDVHACPSARGSGFW
jgi:hypothetical protein